MAQEKRTGSIWQLIAEGAEGAERPIVTLFDTTAAADYLGLTRAGLRYHLYKAADLKPSILVGRALLFSKRDLDLFKAGSRQPTTAAKPSPAPA